MCTYIHIQTYTLIRKEHTRELHSHKAANIQPKMHAQQARHKNTRKHTLTQTHTHTHMRTHIYTHTHMHTHIHTHTHTHIHTHTHTHLHTHTHTHTHTQMPTSTTETSGSVMAVLVGGTSGVGGTVPD